jgi:hypothetical protein
MKLVLELKKALQFNPITHGQYLKIFILNVNNDIKNHKIAKTQGKIRNKKQTTYVLFLFVIFMN